jgi:enoyl-CoA hydratase/carnithine racemase
MNSRLHKDMTAALKELRYGDAAAVLVITGAGNAFCAGMDPKEVCKGGRLQRVLDCDTGPGV